MSTPTDNQEPAPTSAPTHTTERPADHTVVDATDHPAAHATERPADHTAGDVDATEHPADHTAADATERPADHTVVDAADEVRATEARRAPTPPPTSPADQLVRQLYGLSALRRDLGRAATREIASNGFTALAAIHRLGPCRVSDIAHELHVDLSVASRQISALVDAGHVRREVDPADRRAQLVSTTDAGFAVLVGAHERMVEQLQAGLEEWTDDEIVGLATGIERLVAQFTERRHASANDTGDDTQEVRA